MLVQDVWAGDNEKDKSEDEGAGKFVGNVAVVTDYLQRGISQTDRHPAVQGLLEYDLKTGVQDILFYASLWASNVDFDDSQSFMELDNSFGFRGKIEDLTWDLGAIYYLYPGVSRKFHYNYWEIPLQLTYPTTDITTLGLQYFYSPNYSGDLAGFSGRGHFLNGTIEIKPELPFECASLTLDAMAGYQWVENNVNAGFPDYANWNVGPTLKIDPLSFNVIYSGTTLSEKECYQGKNWCGDTVVFSITAGF